jgi:hypothetical protein
MRRVVEHRYGRFGTPISTLFEGQTSVKKIFEDGTDILYGTETSVIYYH